MKRKLPIITFAITLLAIIMVFTSINLSAASARQMESLDRGVVAVKVSNGVFVSWRLLGTEEMSTSFNVYRNGTKITSSPITNSTNYLDYSGNTSNTYTVSAVINGSEQAQSASTTVLSNNYKDIPLSIPSGGTTPDGVYYTYSANDCSVGDLNGDGQYEIIVKWDPSNAKDNSQSGYTGNVYLDAYTLSGNRMWRINLGRNIRAGAHYTQFMVYDLNGDGKAEVACKTADGTIDGVGKTIGSSSADYRNSSGYVLSGPEYLTVFNGQSGAAITTINYEPSRGTVSDWGDKYGNRVDRFLACIAYLDGAKPSLVMCRGYYTRAVLVAYDFNGSSLSKRWTFDSNYGYSSYTGQGNHNLSVGDVDGDGRDEIVYGSCTIDDNGKGLYSTGLGHGDALHLGDFNPNRSGLEVWQCHEGGSGATFRDARTGSVIFKYANSGDVGRACAADLTASTKGMEVWASGTSNLYSCTGGNAGSQPGSTNFVCWWDGDLSRELLNGTTISKYSGSTLLNASNCVSVNGTKSNPALSADIFGDWREEVIFPTSNSSALRIFTTTDVTTNKLYTLMHDPQYRLSIAWQNVAYNQPPHTGFYLGNDMSTQSKPNISLVGGSYFATTAYPVANTPTPTANNSYTWSSSTTYQAENASYGNNSILESSNGGYQGYGYINFPASDGYLEFRNVDGGTGGNKNLQLRYALGATDSRTGRIQINGGSWQYITFSPTGSWTNWSNYSLSTYLNSGAVNTIRIDSTGQDLANIDELTINY